MEPAGEASKCVCVCLLTKSCHCAGRVDYNLRPFVRSDKLDARIMDFCSGLGPK